MSSRWQATMIYFLLLPGLLGLAPHVGCHGVAEPDEFDPLKSGEGDLLRLVNALFTDAVAVFTALNDDEEDHVRAIFPTPRSRFDRCCFCNTHSSIVYIHALKRYHPSHPRGTVLTPSGSI